MRKVKELLGNLCRQGSAGLEAWRIRLDANYPNPVTVNNGFISNLNTTNGPLAPNQVFTGSFESTIGFSSLEMFVSILPINAQSTTTKSFLQWSWDGVNVDFVSYFTVFASSVNSFQGLTTRNYNFEIQAPFVRLVYTNDVTKQTYFKCGLIFHRVPKGVALNYGFSYTGSIDPVTGLATPSGTWDPLSITGQQVLLNTGARTATTTSFQMRNTGNKSAIFNLNVSVVPASPSPGGLELQILALDGSANAVPLNAMLPMASWITKTGNYRWAVGLGASGTNLGPNFMQAISLSLPARFQGKVIHHDAQSYTYNLQVDLT